MKIVATYDFNGGKNVVLTKYIREFSQIESVIDSIDSKLYKTKESTEKTMKGKMLFSPVEINKAFKTEFLKIGWSNHKVNCKYIHGEYLDGYIPAKLSKVNLFVIWILLNLD